jgi:hypothetical protein
LWFKLLTFFCFTDKESKNIVLNLNVGIFYFYYWKYVNLRHGKITVCSVCQNFTPRKFNEKTVCWCYISLYSPWQFWCHHILYFLEFCYFTCFLEILYLYFLMIWYMYVTLYIFWRLIFYWIYFLESLYFIFPVVLSFLKLLYFIFSGDLIFFHCIFSGDLIIFNISRAYRCSILVPAVYMLR